MVRYIKYQMLSVLAILAIFSCQNRSEEFEIPDNKEVSVRLTLPLMDQVMSRSVPTFQESVVDYNSVYFFSLDSEKILADAPIKAIAANEGSELIFKASLEQTSEPRTLYAIVNSEAHPLDYEGFDWQVGVTTLEEIQQNYNTQSFDNQDGTVTSQLSGNHPMSAVVELTGGISNDTEISMTLKRVTAKVVVSSSDEELEIVGLSLMNAPSQSSYIEGNESNPSQLLANFSGNVAEADDMYVGVEQDANSSQSIYFFESNNAQNHTFLLLKAKYMGEMGYYKIDFLDSDSEEMPLLKRNVWYSANIEAAHKAGYATAEEAIENVAANRSGELGVGVEVSDGVSQDMVSDGDYYLGLSHSECYFYIDALQGITASTLAYDLPTNDKLTLTINGDGVTFAEQDSWTLNSVRTVAQLNVDCSTSSQLPLKFDFSGSSSSTTIRITSSKTNLTKKLLIVKNEAVEDGTTSTIDMSDFNANDFTYSKINSNRLSINCDGSLNVDDTEEAGVKLSTMHTMEGFCSNERGSVLVAVALPMHEMCYYEKYKDGSFGIYQAPEASTISNSREITEAGYGFLFSEDLGNNVQLEFNDTDIQNAESMTVVKDYFGTETILYGVSQHLITEYLEYPATTKVELLNTQYRGYCYPLFAKGVSNSATITNSEQNYFAVRTPLQLRNLSKMIITDYQLFYEQERDLDFSCKEALGGSQNDQKSIIDTTFTGTYNGNNHKISNVVINNAEYSKCGIFTVVEGTVKNLELNNISIQAKNQIGGLVAIGQKKSVIDNIQIINSSINGTGNIGGIAGTTKGMIFNCVNNSAVIGIKDYVGGIVGKVTDKSAVVSTCANYGKVRGFKYIAGIAALNNGMVENCFVLDSTIKNRIPKIYGVARLAGGVARNEGGVVRDILVFDMNPDHNEYMIMHDPTYGQVFGAGVVNDNLGAVSSSVCIAMLEEYQYESGKGHYVYPAVGFPMGGEFLEEYEPQNCYYLQSDVYNAGGTAPHMYAKGLLTKEFNKLDVAKWGLSDAWHRVEGFPYPMLKSFPVPTSWPVVGNEYDC